MNESGRAAELEEAAASLKSRFKEHFWLNRENFVALALDAGWQPLRTIASNPGRCLDTGILDHEMIRGVTSKLMEESMFSGWGVRTLASDNPGYDPFSYHRGSVWPVDNAAIARGLSFSGMKEEANRIIQAQLELCTLFQKMRLPELVSGHPKSRQSPTPGLFPYANPIQAWSASAIPMFLEAILDIRPDAPSGLLNIHPMLPEWLPWVELHGLQIGATLLDLNFWRDEEGGTSWQVRRQNGPLRVAS